MSASNNFPAQGDAAQPVTDPQFVSGVAPEERKYVSRALWLNVIPVLVIVAAVVLFFLLSVVLSSAYAF